MRPMRSFGLVMSEVPVQDEIGGEAAGKEVDDVLNRRHRHPLCRLLCQAGDMRCEHNLVECEERMILRGRLVVEDVETRGGDPPTCQSGGQRGLVHDPAAGGVADDSARLKTRELLCAQARSPGPRHGYRNYVTPAQPIPQPRCGPDTP